jgi:hypothetical protein
LTPQNSKLKGVDGGNKTKKQSDGSTTTNVQFTAAEHKASEEGVNSLVAIINTPTDIIGTALAIDGTSEAVGTLSDEDQEKKDPPLT